MGIHSDAVQMSALTGKPVAECKKLRKEKAGEINDALVKAGSQDPVKVMVRVCFGTGSSLRDKQVQSSKPEKQVRDSKKVEKGIIETRDEEEIGVSVKDEATPPAPPPPARKPKPKPKTKLEK